MTHFCRVGPVVPDSNEIAKELFPNSAGSLEGSSELVWMAFAASGHCLSIDSAHRSLRRESGVPQVGETPENPSILPTRAGFRYLYPYWRLKHGGAELLIDTFSNSIVSGYVPLEGRRVAAKLALYSFICLFNIWITSFVIGQVAGLQIFFLAKIGLGQAWTYSLVALIEGVVISSLLYRAVLGVLGEPVQQFLERRKSFGSHTNPSVLFWALSGVCYFLMALIAVIAVISGRWVITISVVVLSILCYLSDRQAKLEQDRALQVSRDIFDTKLGIRISLGAKILSISAVLSALSFAPAETGAIIEWTGAWTIPPPQANSLESHLLNWVILIAVLSHRGMLYRRRLVMVGGMGMGYFVGTFLGDLGGLLACFMGVGGTFYVLAFKESRRQRKTLRSALEISWRFSLATSIGRIAGTILGGFYLGTAGIVFGAQLGEAALALLVVESSEDLSASS